jgi:hypothetical protein
LASVKFRFLEDRGFRRTRALESETSLLGTAVYLGRHVGFIFSVDLRDQCVDARVVKVVDGHICDNTVGGYSSDVFGHLVKQCGYRGSPSGPNDPHAAPPESPLARMVEGWASLLLHAGEPLLQDAPGSMPSRT